MKTNPLTAGTVPAALAAWSGIDPARDYYRIKHRSTKAVAVHDRLADETWWYAEDLDDISDLPAAEPLQPPWQRPLEQLVNAAREADLRLHAGA